MKLVIAPTKHQSDRPGFITVWVEDTWQEGDLLPVPTGKEPFFERREEAEAERMRLIREQLAEEP